ncbi:hypothetical protein [Roseomonas rosulenta]|uniref:hypothetical protein n=1 Tax=Roseomonas rosulenta TaxID=2748667 RepID=UPI0018E05E06|nr:hypothetical protein [Roseomonas rosulenta]
MGRFMAVALSALLVVAGAAGAQAQTRVLSRAEVQVVARDDSGGATPYCAMVFRLRNVGTTRLSVFAAEIAATDLRSGAPLRVPTTTIPFSGVAPGKTKEWTTAGAHGAACAQVRLQVTRVTCMTRCESVAWTQQGLGALEAAP